MKLGNKVGVAGLAVVLSAGIIAGGNGYAVANAQEIAPQAEIQTCASLQSSELAPVGQSPLQNVTLNSDDNSSKCTFADGTIWDIVALNDTYADSTAKWGTNSDTDVYNSVIPARSAVLLLDTYSPGVLASPHIRFAPATNSYRESELRTALLNRFDQLDEADRALITPRKDITHFCGGTLELMDDCEATDDKGHVTDANEGFWAMSNHEAKAVNADLRINDKLAKITGSWLRSPGYRKDFSAFLLSGDGRVVDTGLWSDANAGYYIARPAAFMNLNS